MGDTRAQQVRRIAEEALVHEGADREAFLVDSCGQDQSLRSEVIRLIEGEATDKTIVDEDSHVSAPLPKQIGRYGIRRVLGSGGMGTVYEAIQDKPRRKVAVKVMRTGVTSRKAAKRFEYESQILGRLSHTGIAQVYEAGTYDDGSGGVPYFAMEYIAGAKTILEYVHLRTPSREDVLKLFCEVCDAVHHGHTKGIIHRDLKPGNVLVDREGQPRIIDFGVARATDSDMAVTTLQTDVGQLIGTVQYMSPEQCEADPDILDTRSDVYALGIMLYELLTNKLPYDLKTVPLYEAANIIRQGTPSKISTIDRGLRGDLETIVSKAIEKDRDRRYQSALELKQDLERYLRGDPIEARPPSIAYQLQLLARRNRGLVATIIVILLVMVVATVWSWMERARAVEAEAETATALLDAESARQQAEMEAARAEQVAGFLKHVVSMASPKVAQGESLSMNEILDRTAAEIDEQFGDFPLVESQVRSMIGEIYITLGRLPEAEQNLREAITLMEAHQSQDIERLLQARLYLAEVIILSDRIEEADRMTESLLIASNDALGEDAAVTLYAMELRVMLLEKLARFDEAAPMAIQVAAGYERIYGNKSELTLRARLAVLGTAMVQVAVLGESESRSTLIEQLKADIVAIHEEAYESLGERHPVTLQITLASGFIDYLNKDFIPAQSTLKSALEDSRLVLGQEHPRTLEALAAMGQISVMMGNVEEAEAYLKEALAGYERTTGLTTSSAQMATSALANVYLGQEEYDQAISMAKSALEAQRKVLGMDHPLTVQSRAVYSAGLAIAGRINEDREVMEQSIRDLELMIGPLDARTFNQRLLLAMGLMKSDEPDDALEAMGMLQSIHADCSESQGPDDILTLSILAAGIKEAIEAGHREGLLDIVVPMHAIAMENPGPSGVWILISGRAIDFIASEPGYDEDLEPLISALRPRVESLELEDASPALKMARGHVLVLGRLGRTEEARELALSTVSEAEKALGTDHKVTIQLQEWLHDNP
ncbi:MAG: protein kinase [Phycisphaerales bacterium]|nr:protein kinase [Phycisphaerales bacterium]